MPLDSGVEIERELTIVKRQYADAVALDTPKGKILDSAGKARNEALHERLAYLRKKENILNNAQTIGIDNAIQLAEQEGSDILSAFDRQFDNQIVSASSLRRMDVSQKIPPDHMLSTTPTSHRRQRNIDEWNKRNKGLGDMGKKNYLPVDPNDGLGGYLPTDETIQNRYMQKRLKLPAQPPVSVPQKSGFFSKTMKFGAKGLRFLPLVGEVWTRKENALLASAHALTEVCINQHRADAVDTTLYVGRQYVYRGFGFLSFIPNLADSVTPESIQGTLDFLSRAGCFNEYRLFVEKNKSIFADLGLLDDLSLFSNAELAKEERNWEDLQIRLNPSRNMIRYEQWKTIF